MLKRIKRGLINGAIVATLMITLSACTNDQEQENSLQTEIADETKIECVENSEEETNLKEDDELESKTTAFETVSIDESKEEKETSAVSNVTGNDFDFVTVKKRTEEETADKNEILKLSEIKANEKKGQEVFDDGNLKIEMTEINTKSNPTCYELKFNVENKTEQNLRVVAENSLVNDFYMNFGSSDKVPADSETEIKMTIYKSDVEETGKNNPETIEFNLFIFDADFYDDYDRSKTIMVPILND